MAGAAGFEPAHVEIKTRCLTAWLRPNIITAIAIMYLQLYVYCYFIHN
jgi:hypothetical protein